MQELEYIKNLTRLNLKGVAEKLKTGQVNSIQEHKATQDILDKARIYFEIESRDIISTEESQDMEEEDTNKVEFQIEDIKALFGE